MDRISGTAKSYGTKPSYGEFKDLKDCATHMSFLMRSFGNIINFKCLEV